MLAGICLVIMVLMFLSVDVDVDVLVISFVKVEGCASTEILYIVSSVISQIFHSILYPQVSL